MNDRQGVPTPVGGQIMTPVMKLVLWLAGITAVMLVYRFMVGLGPVTNMDDGHPWGIWIAFDDVTGTALACGGYAVALLIYVFNKGKYHPLIRAAILTSALGYTLGAVGVIIDLGRPWSTIKLPIFFWTWNLDSIQLAVALCMMLYMAVLWIELAPVFMERWEHDDDKPKLQEFSKKWTPKLEKAMPWLIALGLVLPAMHQSGLGSMILLAGPKLHPLWLTGWLPFFFLISCIAMGYGLVVLETMWSRTVYSRYRETSILLDLSPAIVMVLLIWVGVRLFNVVASGKAEYLFNLDRFAILFWLEILLFTVPAIILMLKPSRTDRDRGRIFLASGMIITGGMLQRFSAYWFAYNPGEHWNLYFPSLFEIFVTVGLISAEVAAFMYIIKRFPILTGRPSAALPS